MNNLLKINGLLNKKILFILITLTLYCPAKASGIWPIFPLYYDTILCDACGCSSSGGTLGMGGIIDNNFVGVRYFYQKYESKDGIFRNSPTIDEHFNTVQIWSRIPIMNRLEAQVFIPYHFHSRIYSDRKSYIKGLGDISLLVHYTLFNKSKNDYNIISKQSSKTNHLIKIGMGIKLPTGKFDEVIHQSSNPSFQLGTGSVDYITSLQYIYKHQNFGITNYLNYHIKTANNKDYKFGNQYNISSTLFYVLKNKHAHTFVPSIGFSGEFYHENKQYTIPVKNSNGHAVLSNIGLEYNTPKTTIGIIGIVPIHQHLAQGTVKVEYKTSIYLNYNF